MIIRRVIARLLGRELVWLIDFDGEYTLRMAKKQLTGEYFCYRMWPQIALVGFCQMVAYVEVLM